MAGRGIRELGRERLHFPKELILLGGAPGSGKGTNTAFIQKVRGIGSNPIVISQLLDSPEAKEIKAGGGMVGDEEVLRLLLHELLDPTYHDSALLDGFIVTAGNADSGNGGGLLNSSGSPT